MKIKIINNYYTDENAYLVYDENILSGMVIDPGSDADKILAACNESNVIVKCILLTHCHYDHILGLPKLREITGTKLISSKYTSINIGDPDINHSVSGLGYAISEKSSDIILSDNEEFTFDGIKIKCILTPGHTNGGACYLVNDSVLFSGDTLFLRSIGRSDLPTGNGEELVNSIKNKLYTLDENITVYPGHGKQTEIGYEKKYNMFVCG